MTSSLRTAHLVVGGIAVVAFLVTGYLMGGHQPPVAAMDWDDRLLFRSRHIYILFGALVNLAIGIHYVLPDQPVRRWLSITGSLLLLAGVIMLFFAFFYEPMAGRDPGPMSSLGLFALFGGSLSYVLSNLGRRVARPT